MKNLLAICFTTCFYFVSFSQTIKNNVDTNNINLVLADPAIPEFPGGQDSLEAFICRNLKWPSPDFCGEGRVIVQFQVDTTGKISNVEVIRHLSPLFDEEAIRIVKIMPKWKPVSTQTKLLLPIRFDYQYYWH